MKILTTLGFLLFLTGCSLTGNVNQPLVSSGEKDNGLVSTIATGEFFTTGTSGSIGLEGVAPEKESVLIANKSGDVVFQSVQNLRSLQRPKTPSYSGDSIRGEFIPSYLPNKIQALKLSDKVTIYMRSISESGSNDQPFKFTMNIGIMSGSNEIITKGFEYNWIGEDPLQYFLENDFLVVINYDGYELIPGNYLFASMISKIAYHSDDILNSLKKIEANKQGNYVICNPSLEYYDKIVHVGVLHAKSNCSYYQPLGDEFELVKYIRNPDKNDFTYVGVSSY